jgi:hypothetical protein
VLLAATLSAAPLALQETWEAEAWPEEGARPPRVLLSVWGGEAYAAGGSGRNTGFVSAEAAWAFRAVDVGIAGARYGMLRDASRPWTPVVLARFTQRFKTGRGVEAAFGFGLGAARPAGWIAWYQVSLGVRVPLGPLFVAGELAFEQYDLLRLGGGLGVAF